MATKKISPLRVWLFALVILAILAALGGTLFVVLEDPFSFLADPRSHFKTLRNVRRAQAIWKKPA
jgi:hypothetical protein